MMVKWFNFLKDIMDALGKNGSQHTHTHSVGIEVNNFGYLKNGKTYWYNAT